MVFCERGNWMRYNKFENRQKERRQESLFPSSKQVCHKTNKDHLMKPSNTNRINQKVRLQTKGQNIFLYRDHDAIITFSFLLNKVKHIGSASYILTTQFMAIQPDLYRYIGKNYSYTFLAKQPHLHGYLAIDCIAIHIWLYSQKLETSSSFGFIIPKER